MSKIISVHIKAVYDLLSAAMNDYSGKDRFTDRYSDCSCITL